MKISIALSLLILALGSTLGWQDHQRLQRIRVVHDRVVAEAAAVGISVNALASKDGVRVTKHERADKDAEARLAAADFIAFAREIEEMEKKGGPPDDKMQQRIIDFMDRMMALDAGQLKLLIAEVRDAKDLKDETRQGLIGFSIMSLANDHPQAALTLFTESSDLLKADGMGQQVVSSALSKWAKDDPAGALGWIRANGEKFPDLVNDETKRGLIAGAAQNDPKLAFSLIGELGLKDSSQTVRSITDAAKTPEERTATLAALRAHLNTAQGEEGQDDLLVNGISSLARGAAGEGFEAGSKWLANANLSEDELQQAVGGISDNKKGADTGKWVEWMGKSLPADKADGSIRQMVNQWAQSDYQAAGKWLAAAPAGETKNTSIRAYAETVSRYEPEAAIDWAATLPAGKERDVTYRRIYENWPKEDPGSKQAAEIFAEKHGLK